MNKLRLDIQIDKYCHIIECEGRKISGLLKLDEFPFK